MLVEIGMIVVKILFFFPLTYFDDEGVTSDSNEI